MSRFFFLYAPTGYSWQVDDPVTWLLEHADNPFLGRTGSRLVLSPDDPDRILRVVLRRCSLVLIHVICEAQVVVHHWGQPAPDIRDFLKLHGLARPEVQITLINKKNEQIVIQPGSDFLHGQPVKMNFPWQEFEAKWQYRLEHEPDDWDVAPGTWGTLSWERATSERMIPWTALKSAWRHDQARPCPNCDTPLMVLRFLWVLPIMFSGIRTITRGCFWCHQEFEEWLEQDFWGWLVKTLDQDMLPTHLHATRKLDLRLRYPSPQPDHG